MRKGCVLKEGSEVTWSDRGCRRDCCGGVIWIKEVTEVGAAMEPVVPFDVVKRFEEDRAALKPPPTMSSSWRKEEVVKNQVYQHKIDFVFFIRSDIAVSQKSLQMLLDVMHSEGIEFKFDSSLSYRYVKVGEGQCYVIY